LRQGIVIRTNNKTLKEKTMYIVHVHIHALPDFIDQFKKISIENARESLKEPGIARFDVIQQTDDPTHFELIEVYRTTEDPAQHKKTAHYNSWREKVESMIVEPRTRTTYTNIFPTDRDW
jgi:(4S)-4-hydroxy-5-phosphonooxypentane-2,3-dione isomerase